MSSYILIHPHISSCVHIFCFPHHTGDVGHTSGASKQRGKKGQKIQMDVALCSKLCSESESWRGQMKAIFRLWKFLILCSFLPPSILQVVRTLLGRQNNPPSLKAKEHECCLHHQSLLVWGREGQFVKKQRSIFLPNQPTMFLPQPGKVGQSKK